MGNSALNLSARSRARVWLFTALGTIFCIAVAFGIDSYSWQTGTWRWGSNPLNNLVIPLVLAPPIFFFLLSKLRELANAHHELMNLASTDSLTSCLNRRAFTAMVEGYLDKVESEQAKPEGGFLVVDVDHFKRVNDRYGHDIGDEALQLIARSIRSTVREIDLVGRLGGEEFGVFLPGLPDAHAATIAERIRQAVGETAFSPSGKPYKLSVSIGGATFDQRASFPDLYRQADQYLYAAKQGGRNRVEIHAIAAGAPVAARMALN